MRVINISLDKKILQKDSQVAQRAIDFGKRLDSYFIVVVGAKGEIDLSDNTKVVGISASNKFFILFDLYRYLFEYLSKSKQKYDLITVQDPYYIASLAISIAKRFGLKIEMQIHGFEKLSFFRRYIAQKNITEVDMIRVVSQRLLDYVQEKFVFQDKKIYIAPVAVDKDRFLQINKEKNSDKFVFLTASRLVKVKNISSQIKAMTNMPDNTKLLIVGDGPEKDNLFSLVKKLNLDDRVEFVGWKKDLQNYYSQADCFLLTSESEGYGMVVAEAVLCGLPVVMTDVGVAGELVEDGVNGLIISYGDQKSLEKAMKQISSDQNLYQKFSQASISFYDSILDKEELVDLVVYNWQNIS